jgi:hypothetical protein
MIMVPFAVPLNSLSDASNERGDIEETHEREKRQRHHAEIHPAHILIDEACTRDFQFRHPHDDHDVALFCHSGKGWRGSSMGLGATRRFAPAADQLRHD